MSDFTLNVTASEPFADNAPITRAMLRNASVPIVTATGSVGSEFIQSGAITNAKVSATASEAIAHTKIAVPEGSLVIGGTNNIGSELEPTSNLAGNGVDGNVKLLADTGTKYEALVTSLSSTGGHVGVQKNTANNGVNTLKLVLNTGVITGAHVSNTEFYDDNSITKNGSSGKLEIKDNGVHHQKLYAYKDAGNNPKAGFLTYGAGGAAHVVEATAASQIVITSGLNSNPGTKIFQKELDFGQFLTTGSNWKRIEHGLGTVPMSAEMYLQCTAFHSDHGYAVGDRLWLGSQPRPSEGLAWAADNKYVYVYNHLGSATFFKKCGGNSTAANSTNGTHQGNVETGSNSLTFDLDEHDGNFAVRVRVTG